MIVHLFWVNNTMLNVNFRRPAAAAPVTSDTSLCSYWRYELHISPERRSTCGGCVCAQIMIYRHRSMMSCETPSIKELEKILFGGKRSAHHVDEVWPNLFLGDMWVTELLQTLSLHEIIKTSNILFELVIKQHFSFTFLELKQLKHTEIKINTPIHQCYFSIEILYIFFDMNIFLYFINIWSFYCYFLYCNFIIVSFNNFVFVIFNSFNLNKM